MNRPFAFVVFTAFLSLMASTIAREPLGPMPDFVITTKDIGMQLFTTFIVPFEILSAVLLAAMIGAIYIAKPEVD